MSETTTTAAPVAATNSAASSTAQEPQSFSREYVHELREEAKSWRQKVSVQESAVQAAKAEAEKVKVEAEKIALEARTAADQRVVRAELKAAALKAGMVDPDGLKLLDTSVVQLDEDGEVVIPEDFFDKARKSKPYLFGEATTTQTRSAPRQESPKQKTARDMDEGELRAFERQHGIRL